jgi:hypothetical protein
VSLVNPVHIIEEREHERASAPSLDAPIQILPQSEHEVESALDTELCDVPRTLIDRSSNEIG